MIYIKGPHPISSTDFCLTYNVIWNKSRLSWLKKLRPYERWDIPVAYLVCLMYVNDWELHRMQSLIRSKVVFLNIKHGIFSKPKTKPKSCNVILRRSLQFGNRLMVIALRDCDVNRLLPEKCSLIYKWVLLMKWAPCRCYCGSPQIECGSS